MLRIEDRKLDQSMESTAESLKKIRRLCWGGFQDQVNGSANTVQKLLLQATAPQSM